MRKQLHEIEEIEHYLLGHMPAADKLVFRARMIINGELKEKVILQKKILQIVKYSAREQKRTALASIYTQLSADPEFSSQLREIFK